MNQRTILNWVLVLIAIFLGYLMVTSITDPIAFKDARETRESAVVDRLKRIREAQEAFRGLTGRYAKSFEELNQVLNTQTFKIIKVTGDADDPNNPTISYDTIYRPAKDSMITLGLNLDSLPLVPYGEGAKFEIQSDTLTYQGSLVNVLEVGVQRKVFMGKFKDPRFKKFDKSYDPDSKLKFGDMNAPNTTGNWER